MKVTVLNEQNGMLFVHNQEDNIFVIELKLVLKLKMVTNFVSVSV